MTGFIKVIAPILAGLGLFFVGVKFLGQNLKSLSGSRVKKLIARNSGGVLRSTLGGILAGFLTQSGRALYFILASLVAADFMSVSTALPILFWGNTGRALFALVLVLPMKELTLLILGATGLCFSMDLFPKRRQELSSIFWVALFLFGLDLIKQGTTGFLQDPMFQAFLATLKGHHFASFLLGMLATFICQSNVGITLITITMTQSGVFDQYQMFMVLYGTHAGSCLISYFLSLQFSGTSRQIVMAQVMFNLLGSVLFVALFYVELWWGIPLVKAFSDGLTTDLGRQAAYVAVLFNIPLALILSVFHDPFLRFLEKRWPPTTAEVLGQTAFISQHLTGQPETAILLSGKELSRVAKRLPTLFERLVSGAPETRVADLETMHKANHQVLEKIQKFLGDTVRENVNPEISDSLGNFQGIVDLFTTIEQRISEFCATFSRSSLQGDNQVAAFRILEAVEAATMTMVSFVDTNNDYELELLFQITSEKGSYLEEVKKDYLGVESHLSIEERLFMLALSSQLERIFLPTQKLAGLFYHRLHDSSSNGNNSRQ